MIVLWMSTALAQDLRVEVTVDAPGGEVSFPAHSVEVAVEVGVLPVGGQIQATNRAVQPIVVVGPPSPVSDLLVARNASLQTLDEVVVRTFGPHPTGGPDLLLQATTMRDVVVQSVTLGGSASGLEPTQRVQFFPLCMIVAGYAYDAAGAQTAASSHAWNLASGGSSCPP